MIQDKEMALTIKPTLSCNMRCLHCFNGDSAKIIDFVDKESVYNFLEVASKEYKYVKVTFHGGEPSLAGFDFYNDIFKFQKKLIEKYGTIFNNLFTTNGLFLEDRLIDLLIQNNTLISISFDGPFNDVLRQQGEKVYQNICKVQKKITETENKARLRIFCTVSSKSYPYLLDIYKWFNERELSFKILPIEPRGYAYEDKSLLITDTDDFVEELKKVYKYWIKDTNCKIKFYTFEEFSRLRDDLQFKSFWFNREIALNPNGKIYPFGRPNDVQFCLGDAKEIESIEACFNSSEYLRMISNLENIRNNLCKDCESSKVCNGVCACMSYMYVNDYDVIKQSCTLSNKIFTNMLEINEGIINDFRKGNIECYNNAIKNNFSSYTSK
ncbi:MAG: radical SAM protein [Paraclostridium sp.]